MENMSLISVHQMLQAVYEILRKRRTMLLGEGGMQLILHLLSLSVIKIPQPEPKLLNGRRKLILIF